VSDRPQITIWRMRITCWVPKATNTHSEFVTLTAFPLQQWLHERALILRYAYITGLTCVTVAISDKFAVMTVYNIY